MERTESVFTKRNYMVYEKILYCRGGVIIMQIDAKVIGYTVL